MRYRNPVKIHFILEGKVHWLIRSTGSVITGISTRIIILQSQSPNLAAFSRIRKAPKRNTMIKHEETTLSSVAMSILVTNLFAADISDIFCFIFKIIYPTKREHYFVIDDDT